MCNSRKYTYPPHGRSVEIPRGRGVNKTKLFKEMDGAKLRFLEGLGCKPKTLPWEDMDIFLVVKMLHKSVFVCL